MLKIVGDGIVTNEELAKSVGLTTGNMTDLQKATGISAQAWSDYADTASEAAGKARDEIGKIGPSGADAAAAIDAAAGDISGSLGGIGGAAGAAASAIDGIGASLSALPSYKEIIIDVVYRPKGPGIPKQHGGPVQAHKSYIVGEAGPELLCQTHPARSSPIISWLT